MYFSQIRIDPTNDSRIYVLGVDLSHLRRRRQDVHAAGIDARRSPRDVDQSEQSEPHHRGHRRRRRHQLRPRQDVRGHLQHGPRAVLPRHLRHGDALQRLRRPAGQLLVGRTERGAQPRGHHQRRLVLGAGRRRLRRAGRSEGSAHDLRRVAGRQHLAHRSRHQRAQVDPPGAGARRGAVSLELEHADPDLAARLEHDLRRRQQGLQVDRSRQFVDGDQRRADREHRSRDACR